MPTINSTPFIAVSTGYSIAASSSYLYACYGGLAALAKLSRSADGVDWADDPANITNVVTLIEGSTHIVLAAGDSVTPKSKVLAKSGTTWTDIAAITLTPTGGRYIGGKYFVFAGTTLYYSSDATNWSTSVIPYAVKDVGYDGANYVILTASRIYKTSNLSTLTAYPISFTGHSIFYIDSTYWVSGYTGATPTAIYRSNDLNSFTLVFNSLSAYAQLSSVDNLLFMVDIGTSSTYGKVYHLVPGSISARTELPDITSVYDNAGRADVVLRGQVLINGEYLYVAGGGSIYRAVYNDDWLAGTPLFLSLTNPLPDAQIDVAYSQSAGTVSGGTAPYTWSITSKSWSDSTTITGGTLATTFTTAGAKTFSVLITDSSTPAKTTTGTSGLTVQEVLATGTIEGTLRLDTSTGAFAARKVYLYSYTTGDKLAETTSDGTTGAWSFTAVAPGEYFVVGVAEGADLTVPRDFDALGVITVV